MKAQYENLVPEVFDVAPQQAEIGRVQELVGEGRLKILKGIEVGMHEDHHEDIRTMMSDNSFDQVIASVHYLDGIDPFYGGYYEALMHKSNGFTIIFGKKPLKRLKTE